MLKNERHGTPNTFREGVAYVRHARIVRDRILIGVTFVATFLFVLFV